MDDARYFIVEKNGISIYRDAHHLSANGAKMMLVPFLKEAFKLPNNQLHVSG